MAKSKKEEFAGMEQFLDDSWIEGRQKEVMKELSSGYNPATDILLVIRWDGEWEIRLLPILRNEERAWLRLVGWHWNVLPESDNEKKMPIGCPKINLHEECIICNAIDELVGKRIRPFTDFGMNGNGLAVQKRALVRGLLLNYEAKTVTKTPPVFDFSEGPLLRVIGVPTGTIGVELSNKLTNPKFGFDSLLHPVKGKVINLSRDNKKWSMDLLDSYEIPQEFLDISQWPDIENFIPKTTSDEVRGYIEKYQRSLDADVVNFGLSINTGIKRPQLTEGPTQTEQNLRDKLKNI